MLVAPTISDTHSENNFVILIDDAHNQFINSSLLKSAITDLEDMGFFVFTTSEEFSNTTLTGVDLLIIPNPGDKVYSPEEIAFLDKWLLPGNRGLILLSNPLIEGNDSLSGKPNVFNTIISSPTFGLNPGLFISSEVNSRYPVKVLTLESLNSNSLTISNVSPPIFDNESLNLEIVTDSTALNVFPSEAILSAGFSSFVVEKNGLYSRFETANYLFGAIEKDENRYILGGSTIMFSDIQNVDNPPYSWYETADNSIFWQNIVKWTLNFKEETSIVDSGIENMSLLLLGTAITGSVITVTGFSLYLTGKEIKLFDSKLVSSINNTDEEIVDKAPLSKSQKKLQQRMKNKNK
jgi:hypothetical protein